MWRSSTVCCAGNIHSRSGAWGGSQGKATSCYVLQHASLVVCVRRGRAVVAFWASWACQEDSGTGGLICSYLLQELRVFLEGDGVLALCPEWQRLQPANGTLLDGVARLPKQLLGEPLAPRRQCCRVS